MVDEVRNMSSRCRSRAAGALLILSDSAALTGALIASLWLRYDHLPFARVLQEYIYANLLSLGIALTAYALVFSSFRLYRYAWRFASLDMLWNVVMANTIGLLGLIVSIRVFGVDAFSSSVYVVFWLLSTTLIGGMRVLLRLISLGSSHGITALKWIRHDAKPKRVLILGSGQLAVRVMNALRDDPSVRYEVLGLLDDVPEIEGQFVRNAKVLGPLSKLHKMLEGRSVDEVLIALQNIDGSRIREYALACRKKKVPVKIIPAISDLPTEGSLPPLEEISVEDLLRRPPVRINLDKIGGCLTGARVLVTGAGGSIGSELCRQILPLNPEKLVLVGHGENSLHDIQMELRRTMPSKADRLHLVVASVADEVRIDQVFNKYRPHVVFHAAAHKHVPIMEDNILEAAQNNVLGTNCIAECCGRYGVEKMVMVSTDKAVSPSSVMGATKWLCEQVVRSKVEAYPRSKFVTVRFGNVLGSRGSVVPIFHDAIKNGGPVKVTHEEMTRFFMLIPEAVELVLQAGAAGESGQLLLLDMGQPVKIADLANDMIRLCGFEPNVDIPIVYSGVRPGEKLHESLTCPDEQLQPAPSDGLFLVKRPTYFGEMEIEDLLDKIREAINSGESGRLEYLLYTYVPGFKEGMLPAHLQPMQSEVTKTEEYHVPFAA